jgi:hypothetical protein
MATEPTMAEFGAGSKMNGELEFLEYLKVIGRSSDPVVDV